MLNSTKIKNFYTQPMKLFIVWVLLLSSSTLLANSPKIKDHDSLKNSLKKKSGNWDLPLGSKVFAEEFSQWLFKLDMLSGYRWETDTNVKYFENQKSKIPFYIGAMYAARKAQNEVELDKLDIQNIRLFLENIEVSLTKPSIIERFYSPWENFSNVFITIDDPQFKNRKVKFKLAGDEGHVFRFRDSLKNIFFSTVMIALEEYRKNSLPSYRIIHIYETLLDLLIKEPMRIGKGLEIFKLLDNKVLKGKEEQFYDSKIPQKLIRLDSEILEQLSVLKKSKKYKEISEQDRNTTKEFRELLRAWVFQSPSLYLNHSEKMIRSGLIQLDDWKKMLKNIRGPGLADAADARNTTSSISYLFKLLFKQHFYNHSSAYENHYVLGELIKFVNDLVPSKNKNTFVYQKILGAEKYEFSPKELSTLIENIFALMKNARNTLDRHYADMLHINFDKFRNANIPGVIKVERDFIEMLMQSLKETPKLMLVEQFLTSKNSGFSEKKILVADLARKSFSEAEVLELEKFYLKYFELSSELEEANLRSWTANERQHLKIMAKLSPDSPVLLDLLEKSFIVKKNLEDFPRNDVLKTLIEMNHSGKNIKSKLLAEIQFLTANNTDDYLRAYLLLYNNSLEPILSYLENLKRKRFNDKLISALKVILRVAEVRPGLVDDFREARQQSSAEIKEALFQDKKIELWIESNISRKCERTFRSKND